MFKRHSKLTKKLDSTEYDREVKVDVIIKTRRIVIGKSKNR